MSAKSILEILNICKHLPDIKISTEDQSHQSVNTIRSQELVEVHGSDQWQQHGGPSALLALDLFDRLWPR